MKAIVASSLAAGMIVAFVFAPGCSSHPSAPGGAPPERVNPAPKASTSVLPARGVLFVGTPPATGSVLTENEFEYVNTNGVVAGGQGILQETYLGSGMSLIQVLEPSGAIEQLSPAPAFNASVMGVMTPQYRFVCGSVLPLTNLAAFPWGSVAILNVTSTSSVTCYLNKAGTSTWTSVGVVSSVPRAEWVVGVNAWSNNQFDVAINEDEFWDQYDQNSFGRNHGFTVSRVTVATNGSITVAPATDANNNSFAEMYMGGLGGIQATAPSCGAGSCGVEFGIEGVDAEANCGLPQPGYTCINNQPSTSACTPLTQAQACAPSAAGEAGCGRVADGCGGVITCPVCAMGLTCGGGGTPAANGVEGFCGTHITAPSPATVIQRYGDTQGLLCGDFLDPLSGIIVTVPSPAGTTCGAGNHL